MEKLTSETITSEQIEALREEAITAGDRDMEQCCRQALTGSKHARLVCADAINAARAQVD